MTALAAHPQGCLLNVRAQPGARRAAIVGLHGSSLKVAVTAPADKGRANAALVELLARSIGVKPAQIELVSPPARREKRFLIRGLAPQTAAERLAIVLGEGQSPPGAPGPS